MIGSGVSRVEILLILAVLFDADEVANIEVTVVAGIHGTATITATLFETFVDCRSDEIDCA